MTPTYFLCGIGGSGMLPLALILRAKGFAVEGSDRALDQGRTAGKFEFLKRVGIRLFPQDGSGIRDARQVLVTSAAVEDTVPDVAAARRLGLEEVRRAALLAELFNTAPLSIAIGGTSGKSTTTGMAGFILEAAGHDPTIMNGAVMKNFISPTNPFASAKVGAGAAFVSEVDESDGSIALYDPRIAVVTNISHDHKSMAELEVLFTAFAGRAKTAVLNLGNPGTAKIASRLGPDRAVTFAINAEGATFSARSITPEPTGVRFDLIDRRAGASHAVRLAVPGAHNVENALAAIGATAAAGVPVETAANALSSFSGIKRRFEIVGTAGGITVIDDFAHNPDKIAATLRTLHAFPGRLLVLFQPHGFGPLKLMRDAFVATFTEDLGGEDRLFMPEPLYLGGTAERAVSSADVAAGVRAGGRAAESFAGREEIADRLVAEARAGDRIVIMGARDDTLSEFAALILGRLSAAANAT